MQPSLMHPVAFDSRCKRLLSDLTELAARRLCREAEGHREMPICKDSKRLKPVDVEGLLLSFRHRHQLAFDNNGGRRQIPNQTLGLLVVTEDACPTKSAMLLRSLA